MMLSLCLSLALSSQSQTASHGDFAWGDYDSDGLLDLVVVIDGSPRLYHNSGGGQFSERSEELGLSEIDDALFGLWQDLNADGAPELLIGRGRGVCLFENQSGRAFVDVTKSSGLGGLEEEVLLANWIDYDADGRFDLELRTRTRGLLFHDSGVKKKDRLLELELVASNDLPGSMDLSAPQAGAAGGTRITPGNTNNGHANTIVSGGCASRILDFSNPSACLTAASVPQIGMLYPLSQELFVDAATGFVGIGVTDPMGRLDVAGMIRIRSEGLAFPDGTLQTTAQLVGPQGEPGPAGPTGPQGEPGEDGLGGSGTAQTLALFSKATAVADSVISQDEERIGLNTDSPVATLHIIGDELQEDGVGALSSVLIAPEEDLAGGDAELIFAEDKFGLQGVKWLYNGGTSTLNLQRLNMFGGASTTIFSVGSGGDTYISDDLAVDGDSVIGGSLEASSLRLAAGASDGHVLTSDVEGNATWQASSASPSGSPGFLPLWNAKGALSDSMIAQDSSGVIVGGNAEVSGQTTLNEITVQADAEFNGGIDVGGSLAARDTILVDNRPNSEAKLTLQTGSAGGGSWTAGIKQTDGSILSLFNGGADRIKISAGGRVGIATDPVGGQALTVGGDSELDGTLDVSGAANIGGSLTVNGSTDVIGTLDTDGFKMPTGAVEGHVLTTDASGNASWATPTGGGGGGGNVFGAGQTDRIPKWFNLNTIMSSEIRDKNPRLGYRTDDPQATLHLVGDEGAYNDPNRSKSSMILAPSGSTSGDSEVLFTENTSGSDGMRLTYYGAENLLRLIGFDETETHGSHMTIARTSGQVSLGSNLNLFNSPDDSKGRVQFRASDGGFGASEGSELFMYSDDTFLMDNNEADGSIKLRVNNDDSTSLLLNQTGDVMIGGPSFNYLDANDTNGNSPYGNGVVITSDRHKTRLDLNNTRNANAGSYGNDGGDCEIRFMTDEVVHFSMGVNEHYVTGDNWAENFVISGPSAASNPPPGSTTPAAKGEGGVGSNAFLTITQAGNVGIGTSTPSEELDVAGTIRTKYLEITAGADLVERFEGDSELITPGKLVAIDPENPKHIRLTTSAYDSTVLGVLSGAGGINHGIALGQEGITTGDLPVAMVGRVYAECSTENGPIRPGDLLTSSSIPGVGMKATDTEASFGAVIGKALTGLDDETGLVLVIVNLQ